MRTHKKRPGPGFRQRVYLWVLALFLVFFNATVLGVAWHSNDRAFVSQRDKLLTEQQYIVQSLAEDIRLNMVVVGDSVTPLVNATTYFRDKANELADQVARDENGTVIGAVFGITDFAYWLFVTDLGVARDWEKKGIGTALLQQAHAAAGGEKDIAMYLVANENAIPFYEKFGMWKTTEVMEYNHIDWTPFTVE